MLRVGDRPRRPPDPVLRVQLGRLPRAGEEGAIELDLKEACAATYASPVVRWLLGGELHPGGPTLSRRAFELMDLDRDDHLLDVGSGDGRSVLLAAGERGCRAVGLDYGNGAIEEARHRAEDPGVADRVEFVCGDAESLPFPDAAFDAVISECSLCVFADKGRAVREMRRVLRLGGRVAVSDVVAEVERLPSALQGALGTIACVGEALPPGGHRDLLQRAGFEVVVEEDRSVDASAMADRIADRLRGARIAGLDALVPVEGGAGAGLELVAEARDAIADGRIGYTLISAVRA